MRFGRRGRNKSREPIWARQESAKASLNDSAEIPTDGSVAPSLDIGLPDTDAATQEILTHLGRFSREYASPDNDLWSDACMNQLILCIETAIEEGWSDLVTVLSDTARILQSYENANRAKESIPFLVSAYGVMCRLVGDIVIEKAPQETLEEWTRVFAGGISALEINGLELFQDDEEEDKETMEQAAEEIFEPQAPIAEIKTEPELIKDADALPVLDELPPLESLITTHAEPETVTGPEAKVVEVSPIQIPALKGMRVVDEGTVIDPLEETGGFTIDDLHFAGFEMPRTVPADTQMQDDAEPESETSEEILKANPEEEIAQTPSANDIQSAPDPIADEVPAEASQETNDEAPAVDAVEEEAKVFEPPQIVVDIMDRICEVLGILESAPLEERDSGIDVLLGDLTALENDAHISDNIAAEIACTAMIDAAVLARDNEECWSERFLELNYAFCGIFIEALSDPEGENVAAWQKECEDWVHEYAAKAPQPAETTSNVVAFPTDASKEENDADPVDTATADEEHMDVSEQPELVMLTTDDETDIDAPSLIDVVFTDTLQPEADEVQATETDAETTVAAPIESKLETESTTLKVEPKEEIDHAERSQTLLQSAQEAALNGNGEDAKSFALRAAAEIAMAGVQRAETSLRESEIKLKEGMNNTEEARVGVKSCEESVHAATALVTDSSNSYEEAQAETGRVTTALEDSEADVTDLNRQIQELQAKRDREVEQITQTVEELEKVRAVEQQASNELDELKRLEDDSRIRLEESRQHVKDKHSIVQAIESEMERDRETLNHETISHADIIQAIQQISGTSIPTGEEAEGLLF